MGCDPTHASSDWRKLHEMMNQQPEAAEPQRHLLDDGDGILGFSDKAQPGGVGWTSGYQGFPEKAAPPPRRLDFAGALAALKEGKRVAHAGWPTGWYVSRLEPHYITVSPERTYEFKADAADLDAADWVVL